MNRIVELSGRMQAVAKMVTKGNRVCDVGCDHGYISIYLVQSGIAPGILAMDVNKGPLAKAREHIAKFGAEDYISLRLSDGLSACRTGEADSLICAGMGGRLLIGILEKEPEKTAGFKELILQPQSEIPMVRKFLREKGYTIIQEDMVLEDGKFYSIMKAAADCKKDKEYKEEKTEETYHLEDLFGPLLLQQKNPVLLQFIKREIQVKQSILSRLADKEHADILKRKEELLKERNDLQMAANIITNVISFP